MPYILKIFVHFYTSVVYWEVYEKYIYNQVYFYFVTINLHNVFDWATFQLVLLFVNILFNKYWLYTYIYFGRDVGAVTFSPIIMYWIDENRTCLFFINHHIIPTALLRKHIESIDNCFIFLINNSGFQFYTYIYPQNYTKNTTLSNQFKM